jgi:transposase
MKTQAINTPSNWRDLKRHPLSAEYPDLPPEEGGNRMRAGLKEYGNIGDRRITLFKGMVLDGWQFLQACIYENLEPKFQELVDGDPAAFVEIMNDTRRHENSETIRIRAEKRRKRVVAARQQGQSIRAIAKAENVSPATVHSDLNTPGVQGEHLREKVEGSDGKSYLASRPKLIPELAQMDLSPKIIPILEAMPRGQQLDFARYLHEGMLPRVALKAVEKQREPGDAPRNGKPSSSSRAPSCAGLEAFNIAKFEELDSLVRQLEKGIDELVRLPGGEQFLRCTHTFGEQHEAVQRSKHLDNLNRELKCTRPHAICPYCLNQAKGCTKCNGTGWVSKITWKNAPDDMKARVG